MSLTPITKGPVFVFLCVIMLRLQSSPCTAAPSNSQVRAPTIVNIAHKRIGSGHRLTCKVNPGGMKDETLVYWLAHGDFIEKIYKNITVTNRVKRADDGTEFLQSKIVFRDFSQNDFYTKFTCVALSPAGFAKETIQIRKFQSS